MSPSYARAAIIDLLRPSLRSCLGHLDREFLGRDLRFDHLFRNQKIMMSPIQ